MSSTVGSAVAPPRPAPATGLSRLTTYLCGKEILILGPGSAGKTKFAQYLRWAALDPEGKREMTYAVTGSPAFVVRLGHAEELELKVRRTVDTPGQVGPLQHAFLVARHRPHAALVVLPCSTDSVATLRWFRLFCDALDSVLRKAPALARRLQEMVVILNKRDKVDDRELATLHEAVRKALERSLSIVWGAERVRSIPILECISVRTDHGTALIDSAIVQLAERLAGRPNQPDGAPGSNPAGPAPADLAPAPASGPRSPIPAPASPRSGRSDRPVVASPIRSRPGLSRQSSQAAPTPARAPARSPAAQPTARTTRSRPAPAAADGTGPAEVGGPGADTPARRVQARYRDHSGRT